MDYQKKYLKYKLKYLKLKKLTGGGDNENLSFFLNFNNTCISNYLLIKYNHFSDLTLLNSPVSFIGKGNNSIVNNFNFKNNSDDKNFDIIVKTSLNVHTDNLYYEYISGLCVNKFKKFFPNFCYTFNFCHINDPSGTLTTSLKNEHGLADLTELKEKLKINPLEEPRVSADNFRYACLNNDKVCSMIENVPSSLKLSELKVDRDFLTNLDYNLFCILLQIYVALFGLSDLFTHYDLNVYNVMFTKLDRPIKITYDIKQLGKIITIYTKFIPVIIDYARAHVKCPDLLIESNNIAELVCTVRECNSKEPPLCDARNSGMYFGVKQYRNYLGIYTDVNNFETFHNINPRKINKSHDLLYLHSIMLYNFQHSSKFDAGYLKCKLRDDYELVFDKTKWIDAGKNKLLYGNKELEDSFDKVPKKINTTKDVVRWLINYFDENFRDNRDDTFAEICITTDLSTPFSFKLN